MGLKRTDVIRTFEEPIGTDGTVAILRGNLAPEGSVVKHSAVPKEMFKAVLKAKPFDCEEDAIEQSFPGRYSREMPCLSVMKDLRDRECRKCSIPQKPSPLIRSWEKP